MILLLTCACSVALAIQDTRRLVNEFDVCGNVCVAHFVNLVDPDYTSTTDHAKCAQREHHSTIFSRSMIHSRQNAAVNIRFVIKKNLIEITFIDTTAMDGATKGKTEFH